MMDTVISHRDIPGVILRMVEQSHANNSGCYARLAATATLDQIVHFLQWDAAQPAFNVYLRRWVDKVPEYLRGPLLAHIDEEEREEHSRLFQELLARLLVSSPRRAEIDARRLAALNYTFSETCARDRDHAFFAGSFLATEIMSAKRCSQIMEGLARLGIEPDGSPRGAARLASAPTYLEIHALGDAEHGRQVLRDFVVPVLTGEPSRRASLHAGIDDRLHRSASYLRWYEHEYLL